MARFDTMGLDDLAKDVDALDFSDEETDGILLAGAEQVKKAWKKAAQMHDLRDTGEMIDSIDYAKRSSKVGDVKGIDIYPQGKDSKGVRNAEKAFINHYGTSNPNYPATHFVDDADKLCDNEFSVVDAMEDKFDEICKKKGLV